MLMANRIGAGPAAAVGVGKEMVQGLAAPFTGQSMIGEHGFDPEDVRANLYGISQSKPTKVASMLDLLMRTQVPSMYGR
jgi:hypothetical protein